MRIVRAGARARAIHTLTLNARAPSSPRTTAASGTGYGNFAEMGPLDWNLAPRASTWINAPVNLLFVDSPVGAGYSYVDSDALLPTNNTQIARDLVAVVTAFMAATPSAAAAPFYVFTESCV